MKTIDGNIQHYRAYTPNGDGLRTIRTEGTVEINGVVATANGFVYVSAFGTARGGYTRFAFIVGDKEYSWRRGKFYKPRYIVTLADQFAKVVLTHYHKQGNA